MCWKVIALSEEMTFVRRYLEMESLRFGDRLAVSVDIHPSAAELLVPSFGVHCLVENAVRHGVENTIGRTEIAVTATADARMLTIVVRDSGKPEGAPSRRVGTGLPRLRERVAVLFGQSAVLAAAPLPTGGFESRLSVPVRTADDE